MRVTLNFEKLNFDPRMNDYKGSHIYAGCLKKNFTMVFQMLLSSECYENFKLKGIQTIHR
jgi:hypothetical protein